MMWRWSWVWVCLCWSSGAFAATITVNTADDALNSDGDCSLREAVEAANTNAAVDGCPAGESGLDRIELAAGLYGLSVAGASENANATGDLDVLEALEIVGAGAADTEISGGDIDRVLDVRGVSLHLEGVTISGGRAPDGASGEAGGGIRSTGSLHVHGCILEGNRAGDGLSAKGGDGGAIVSSGALEMTDTVVRQNSPGSGNPVGYSAVYQYSDTNSAWIEGCHFSDNGEGALTGRGPRVDVVESAFTQNAGTADSCVLAFPQFGTSQLLNVTISGNAGRAVCTFSGNLEITFATITRNDSGLYLPTLAAQTVLHNVILTGNTSQDCEYNSTFGTPDVQGTATNVLGDSCTAFRRPRDLSWSSLEGQLDSALAGHGSNLPSHALVRDSSAVDAGSCILPSGELVTVDQRGVWRLDGSRCDIGAFETGKNTSVGVRDEAPGDICEVGGVAVETGIDFNNDGILGPDEVEDTEYVCETPETPPAWVSLTEEPPGSACENGGQRIDSGIDTNRNGMLDAEEVLASEYVCRGATGEPGTDGEAGVGSLIATAALPVGDAECPGGGQRIDLGLDVDRDGVLSGSEITESAFICKPEVEPEDEDGDDDCDCRVVRRGSGSTDWPRLAQMLALVGGVGLMRRRRRSV